MKPRHLIIKTLAVLLALPLAGHLARAATIEVLETFDYPGALLTQPQKINDHGVIAGVFIDASTGATEGFYRSRNGTFSGPVIDPNDDAAFTQVRGVNNRRTIVGNYNTSDGISHGFFLSHQVFTTFDVSSVFTVVLGINNAGDFSGSFINDQSGVQEGFVDIGGNLINFAVPVATNTLAYQINGSNEATGYYIDSVDGLTHGYLRDSDGTLTFPIDPDGSTGTILFGNNASNWVVGRYSDASGVTHGLFFTTPGDFTTFDFPGSTFTSLNGINSKGYICGRYTDSNGIDHGFLAKVNVHDTAAPHRNKVVVPLRPVNPKPEISRMVVPAS
jgi:hypothetical protein